MSTTSASKAALNKFQERFQKAFGEGTLQSAADIPPYEVIPTGSLILDVATGVGGYPLGRLIELWGIESGGKTTLTLIGLAEAQRKFPGKRTGFIDMEQTFDPTLAQGYGVDIEKLDVFRPQSAEDVADAMKMMLQSGFYSMIVLDSIGAMIPEAEKEKDADEAVVALQAKIVTRMVKIAAVEATRSGTVVLLINQVRANVGGYGADTTTGGGWALRHVTTLKLKVKRTGTALYKVKIAGEDHLVGQEIAIEIEKNKVAPPKRTATINLMIQDSERYGPKGIDKADEATTLGLKFGGITQSGGWYVIDQTGEKVNGRDKVVESLRSTPEIVESIRQGALASLRGEIVTGKDAEVEIPEDEG